MFESEFNLVSEHIESSLSKNCIKVDQICIIISRTGLDRTGLVKRGLVNRRLAKRGLVKRGLGLT